MEASERHRHLPLHRRRGLDAAPARARCGGLSGGARRAPAGDRARPAPRRAGSRSTPRETPSSSPSRPLREAARGCPAMTDALEAGPIQVRVGLHTGTPLLTEEGYVGDDVHFAARVAASGHGGQVVVSAATATLVERELAHGSRRAPAQGHRAGGLHLPARRGLLPAAQDDLEHEPAPPGELLPRSGSESSQVLARIEAGARLVTLTGPGGTGKTRLALEAAARSSPSTRRASSGSGSPPCATPRSSRRRSRRRSEPRTASPRTSASASCCSCSTTWSR